MKLLVLLLATLLFVSCQQENYSEGEKIISVADFQTYISEMDSTGYNNLLNAYYIFSVESCVSCNIALSKWLSKQDTSFFIENGIIILSKYQKARAVVQMASPNISVNHLSIDQKMTPIVEKWIARTPVCIDFDYENNIVNFHKLIIE